MSEYNLAEALAQNELISFHIFLFNWAPAFFFISHEWRWTILWYEFIAMALILNWICQCIALKLYLTHTLTVN